MDRCQVAWVCAEVRGSARKCAEVRGNACAPGVLYARKCAEVRGSARKCAEVRGSVRQCVWAQGRGVGKKASQTCLTQHCKTHVMTASSQAAHDLAAFCEFLGSGVLFLLISFVFLTCSGNL